MKFVAAVVASLFGLAYAADTAASASGTAQRSLWHSSAEIEYDAEFIESAFEVVLGGVDVDDLSPEEDAFIQDALLWSYNKANQDSDVSAFTMHLFAKESESVEEDGEGDRKLRKLGKKGRGRGRFRGSGSWECRFCGDERRKLFYRGADGDVLGAWTDRFCKTVAASRFEAFHALEECSIDTEVDL